MIIFKKRKAIIFFSLFLVGFFLLINSASATEDSIPHNGHACIQDGVKDCQWAFSSTGNYQAWGSDWEFKYKGYGSSNNSATQDICVSFDNQMWSPRGLCWSTVDVSDFGEGGSYKTKSGTRNIDNGIIDDYTYVVLHVRVDHADTSSDFTVEERQVSTDTLNLSAQNVPTKENVDINWGTDWATLGGWLEITGQGQPVYETLFGATSQQSKSGTLPISFNKRGTKTINLYASGPLIDGSSPPDNPQKIFSTSLF